MNKQEVVVAILRKYLDEIKVGVIVKGVDDISPEEIVKELAQSESRLYSAVVGYDEVEERSEATYEITGFIEKAVLWRSMPECAGKIVVFIRNDTEKLHSLAEFEVITTRDVARFLIEQQVKSENNAPTNSFWNALKETSDYYTFDALHEFVSAVETSKNQSEAIPLNMWRLNLLQDIEILGTKGKPEDRLAKNRDLIFAIGQLSEDSRKKLSRALVKTKAKDKARLQKAYRYLQTFYKYGSRDMLKPLDFCTVQELFSASQKTEKKLKGDPPTPPDNGEKQDEYSTMPIRPKELDRLVADAVVFGGEEEQENIKELLDELIKHYDIETEENNESIPTLGGMFEERSIIIESHQTDLRKLVGKFCNESAWGGVMETEESVLKDAISADIESAHSFDPEDKESVIAFAGGIDGSQSLFDFITQFDAQFDSKEIDTAERFSPIIRNLKEKRAKLFACLDMIMYHPVLLFGASDENRLLLIDYIEAWEQLYHAFCVNEPAMRQISAGGTSFIARAILLLDVLYVKTPKEWKGILLPLHPVFLWRYYEVFKTLPNKKASLNMEDKEALSKVLSQLPQVLSFIVANTIITETTEDRILPCSGSIEMLPTFENKTNRYLGKR